MTPTLTDRATSAAATLLRGGAGHRIVAHAPPPTLSLQLYEFEACPHCRLVREALSALDLEATVIPCTKNSRHRPTVRQLGGKLQFPFFVDPAHQVKMYGSKHIVRYLAKTYGQGHTPWQHRFGVINDMASAAASRLRPKRGMTARGKKAADVPLELWSYEASPYCRLVREALSELELRYILHNVARGSQYRQQFENMSGKMMVPYLKDPNTATAMFESADIVRYLNRTYGN